MNESDNNKRIARNTAFLYVRMFISMVISFFTAGIVLNTLGVVDYGINNVVGGLVSMFSLISSSLSAAASRFITFELGKKDGDPRKAFSTSIHIHLWLAIIMCILLETIGLWFLYNKLVIPPERINAAFWIFQFSILSTMVSLIGVSYIADILANEHMNAFAFIGIFDSLLRLAILFLLLCGNFDKLILYGLLQFLVVSIVQVTYIIYCRHHFSEARFMLALDRSFVKKMGAFSGWNFIGSSAALLRDQGVNMILNIFCGPAVNAARGIGISVNSIVSGFGSNLLSAINPQITKNFAYGDIIYTTSLVTRASRFAFLLLFFIVFPVLVRTELLLGIWLKNVPAHAVLFTQLTLCFSLIEIISNPLITLMLATGDIKLYQIIVGGAQLLNLPLAYVLLWMGGNPESTVVVAIGVSLICLWLRLVMLHRMIGFCRRLFFYDVILRILVIIMFAILFYIFTTSYFNETLFQSFLYIAICAIFNGIVILFVGLKKNERVMLVSYLIKKIELKKQ